MQGPFVRCDKDPSMRILHTGDVSTTESGFARRNARTQGSAGQVERIPRQSRRG
jgi:hypothetical protein